MKKKIILLLIFLVTFMGFGIEVRAIEDHSLNYDIETMEIVDNKNLHIKGWVVKHNYHNYGGNNLLVSFRFVNDDGRVVGVDSEGNILEDFKVKFNDKSLTYAYCFKNSDDKCIGNNYKYENVGFDIYIPLENYLSQLSNDTWSLKIYSKYKVNDSAFIYDMEDLAVYEENFNKDSFKNAYVNLSGVGSKVDVIGNHVRYNGNDNFYWKLTAGKDVERYTVGEKEESTKYNVSRYKLKNGGIDNAKEFSLDNCGFEKRLDVNYVNKKCIGPGSASEDYILSTFVKPNGAIKFKYTGGDTKPDSVCINEDKSINSCSSANLSYNCDKMKIKTTGNGTSDGTVLTAYVKLKEYGRFTMSSYAGKNVEVVAGQGFAIGMSYMYNLSWEMSDIVCNGFDEQKCHELLYKKLNSLSFKNVSSDILENNLNNTGVSEKKSFKENTDENLSSAGSWECNGGLNDYSEGETSGAATIICQYKIKDAYINFDTNYITYVNKNGEDRFKNLGSYFYIPLNYSDSTFSWNVVSDNISLVKVRTVKENYSFSDSHNWNINTDGSLDDSGNVKSGCYVNVKKGSIVPVPEDPSNPEFNVVYRSVDTDISSDESTLDSNLKLYYLDEGTNWYNYFYDINDDGSIDLNNSHFNRIKNTFNNLHYETVTLTNSKINSFLKSYDSESYTSWKNVDSNGISKFINSDYFDVIKNRNDIHCKWGEFNEATCDKDSS